MKILFIVPYVPSLVRIRSFNFIKALSARGHQIILATLWSTEGEKTDLVQVQPYCEAITAVRLPRWRSIVNSLLALPTPSPLQYHYCWQPELANELSKLVSDQDDGKPFDIIHVEHLRGAHFGEYLQQRLNATGRIIPVVWDSVDSITLLFRLTTRHNPKLSTRLISGLELERTSRYEARLIRTFAHTIVTSPKDRDALLNIQPQDRPLPVSVVSNGVDLDYFQAGDPLKRKPAMLVMSGKMSYHANVAMAHYLVEDILPIIWLQNPDVELTIVGKDPPADVREFSVDRRIHVTGTVPDIRPFLQEATLAVAPLRYGVGVQNKVLEAMACATPVVTTPQVLTSLSAEPGRDLLTCETPSQFAEAILTLINNKPLAERIGSGGRRYVENNHSGNAIMETLESVYNSAILQSGSK